jgi:hypothetical protein
VQKWETLKEKMISLKIDSIYSEHIYTQHFLKIERTWASFFCDTWAKLQKTSRRSLDFFEIVNEYRTELKKLVVTSRRQHSTNSTSLQKQRSFAFASINDNKYENFECLCDETHAWKNCSFLIVESRSSEWKANKKKRDQIRQKLESHFKLFWYVQRVATFDILFDILESDELLNKRHRLRSDHDDREDESSREDRERDNDNVFELSDVDNVLVSFANTISNQNQKNLLRQSVTYDSRCSNHITWNKTRFIDEIVSTYEWVSISNEDLLIKDFDIMLVNETLNEKRQSLLFEHTTYVLNSSVILISINKLKKKRFLWNMHFDTVDKNDVLVFELKKHFDLYIVEYNSVDHADAFANFVDSRVLIISKDTFWKFHLRLDHCQSEVINQLTNQKIIELIKDDHDQAALKTIKCETCAVFKMHSLILKISTTKVTKFFQRLHFDLIILKKIDFDETTCVTYFQNDLISFHWVFLLQRHKQKTLLRVVKYVISSCDRQSVEFKLFVQTIRMNQETSFEDAIQNFVEK